MSTPCVAASVSRVGPCHACSHTRTTATATGTATPAASPSLRPRCAVAMTQPTTAAGAGLRFGQRPHESALIWTRELAVRLDTASGVGWSIARIVRGPPPTSHPVHHIFARPEQARGAATAALVLAALLCALLPATARAATPAFVQAQALQVSSGNSNSVAFSNPNSAGSLIVAYVLWNNTGGVTLSDSRGNAYLSAGQRMTWNGSSSSQVFYAKNVAGGANTVTATFASSISGWAIVYVHEYSGVDKSDPLDAQSVAIGTSKGMNSGSVTTTRTNDLLFNAGASQTDVTAGDGTFTTRSTSFGNRTQDRLAATPGTYSAAMTQNANAWVSHLVAFKADTGSTDGTPPDVSITAPANGAQVDDIVNVTADASTTSA